MPESAPFIFLSHSGADSEAARDLKRRLLAAPDARAARLKVWFDKDDLRPGGSWQPQIEQAIADASAFVVYVGSKGVMNWVEAEVRVALSRANTDKGFLFIPALAAASGGSSALPAFAKLYEAVRDPLSKAEEFAKLLKAVLKSDWDKEPKIIDEPFIGLRSMREEEADRFFGRDAEIAELVEKFRRRRIVAIVADSGTGKSSLAEAGFIQAFRGGALADPSRSEPDDRVWHVISMRPGSNPEEGLRTSVSEAARKLRLSVGDQSSIRKLVTVGDPSETAFGLQCNLPPKKTATLLIVDQFEELFTETPDPLGGPLVKLLLDLADGDKDFRILLTVRADYFNLLSDVKDGGGEAIRGADGRTLFECLSAEGGDAILRLKRVSEDGIRDIVCKPLRLAGVSEDETALVKAVQSDISDQPSDLPLLQVALRAAWCEHKATKVGLLAAYHSVGGVLGALAKEAENVRLQRLSADDQARLESIFVRLVRLGDTGGATRRTASLDEFDDARRVLVQQLGRDEYGRLVAVSEKSAEIAHEALITQWPWLQRTLKDDARDVRRLERLMDRSREWRAVPEDGREKFLATGAEREISDELARQRTDWLSPLDREFVEASNLAHQADIAARNAEQSRQLAAAEKLAAAERGTARRTRIGAAVALVFALAAGAFGLYALSEKGIADQQTRVAITQRDKANLATSKAVAQTAIANRKTEEANIERNRADVAASDATAQKEKAARNESLALTALANIEAAKRPVNGTKLALAAWPRGGRDTATPRLAETLDALGRSVPNLRERRLIEDANSAAFSPDGSRIVAASEDNTARVWDAESGKAIAVLSGHERTVNSAAFSPDGSRIVTASYDKTARVWDAASGIAIAVLSGHKDRVNSGAFSPDGSRIVTASRDRRASGTPRPARRSPSSAATEAR